MLNARISVNDVGYGKIEINGVDIAGGVSSVGFSAGHGLVPTLELDLVIGRGADIESPVHVVLPEETVAALIALGWVPPEEVINQLS
jgi:hypothetical protein